MSVYELDGFNMIELDKGEQNVNKKQLLERLVVRNQILKDYTHAAMVTLGATSPLVCELKLTNSVLDDIISNIRKDGVTDE